jgi:hypothetical protein
MGAAKKRQGWHKVKLRDKVKARWRTSTIVADLLDLFLLGL